MQAYKYKPTDPLVWSRDAAALGVSVDEIEYNLYESKWSNRTQSYCSEKVLGNFQDPGNYDQYWVAEPIQRSIAEVFPTQTPQSGHPLFGYRDRRFVSAFEKIAAEMGAPLESVTDKVLHRVDFNRFDSRMTLPKAIKNALAAFQRNPRWFDA